MNNIQGSIMLKIEWLLAQMSLVLLLCIFHISPVKASDLTLSGIDVATLAGDKLQIQLNMSEAAVEPTIFHTENPARIALDFPNTKNGLGKKIFQVNQGTATNIYIAEAGDRVRVVLNLLEATPFETKVLGNKVFLTLNKSLSNTSVNRSPAKAGLYPASLQKSTAATNSLMPKQTISGFDFKRGEKGEGRILISLANPNTIVNSKEESGNVIVSFVNTEVNSNLAKRLDVSEFATPVKFIDTVAKGTQTTMTVTMQNNLYDYSLVQSDGLLTVEFRPLTNEEKDVLEKSRVKYTGERLSLNFQDIEVRSVIAILAEFTGQNVVAGDDVTGTITLKLDDVPWDEALDFVMMTKELGKYETGNVTLVSPLDKIKDYKKKQQETEAVVEQLDPLITEYISINYAKAENFRNLLYGFDSAAFNSCGVRMRAGGSGLSSSSSSSTSQTTQQMPQQQMQRQGAQNNNANNTQADDKYRLLSERGSAVVDSRTNTLIVRETAKRLEEIKKMIRKLDITVRQVMIESRIVVASNSFAKELGVKFGTAGATPGNSNNGDTVFGFGGKNTAGALPTSSSTGTSTTTTPGGVYLGTQSSTSNIPNQLVDLGTSATPYGALGMTLVKGADYVLNLELSALQDEKRGEILSNPRVMTTDRCQANIQQGVEIPYQTSSANSGVNIQFKEAVLKLDVTPQITPNGSIIMDLFISKDAVGDVVNNVPSIDTRNIRTLVRVNDGETVVLGGIFEGSTTNSLNKVPFFADLPGIGFLFKRTNNTDSKQELLIFVTPKVMKDDIVSN
ncbi:type IV pilus secretin PilQ [Methylovulum psychrotolerans]|uniref:Type IV pilus secretin PilQ n=1 Tax=Methylovulum psychrotolerans TaxID=1704499 RepID=A0A2S5CR22_9GAMM|nr:type IV pilus secretin PilQ [Methylovulum psychrotolerans]POZ53281.1 type IV pilus secretin PilQ [Methylovulum psychrotolerans]